MFITANVAFGFSFSLYGAAVVPALAALFLTGIALGIFGCAVVLRLGPASEWLIWPLPAIIAPFAGVYYPLSALPAPLRAVAWLAPPSHEFESLRVLVRGGAADFTDMGVGVLLAAVYVIAAGWFFAYVHALCVRSGLLARYAAESTG